MNIPTTYAELSEKGKYQFRALKALNRYLCAELKATEGKDVPHATEEELVQKVLRGELITPRILARTHPPIIARYGQLGPIDRAIFHLLCALEGHDVAEVLVEGQEVAPQTVRKIIQSILGFDPEFLTGSEPPNIGPPCSVEKEFRALLALRGEQKTEAEIQEILRRAKEMTKETLAWANGSRKG